MSNVLKATIGSSARLFALFVLVVALALSSTGISTAMSEAQRRIFMLGIPYFDVDVDIGGGGGCGAGGDLTDIHSFIRSPISANFGVSRDALHEWYLGHGSQSVQRKNALYGLNASNINAVSDIIEAEGASVTKFWIKSVLEGGGDATHSGFMNHFHPRNLDTSNPPYSVARQDARRMVDASNEMHHNPAWSWRVGGVVWPQPPVPADVQAAGNADFATIPAGTIGRAYIAMTGAAALDIYYPDGLAPGRVERPGGHGRPITNMMNMIISLGGVSGGGGGTCSSSGPPSPEDCSGVTSDGFCVFNQADPRWADVHWSSCPTGTLRPSGCGPVSFAMIATYLLNQHISAEDVAAYTRSSSPSIHVCGSGSSHDITRRLAARFGLRYGGVVAQNEATISNYLRRGYLIHASGRGPRPWTSGGHFIVIRGITGSGQWLVADSNGSQGIADSDREWSPAFLLPGMSNARAVGR